MISIIVPVYNTKEEYLYKCINSLINQTVKNYEIIIVDDGSNIKCNNFLEKYSKYKNIKTIHKNHEGVSTARNIGINSAKNNYIVFVDSDDYVEENMCEIIEKCITENNSLDIICFNTYIDFKNKIIKNPNMPYKKKRVEKEDKEELLLQVIDRQCSKFRPRYNTANAVWGKVYNREFLINNNIYFNNMLSNMEDTIFNLYSFENAMNIVYSDEIFYHYIRNNNSITNNFNFTVIDNCEIAFKEIEKFIEKYNKDDRFYNALDFKKVMSLKSYIVNCFFNDKNNYSFKEAKEEICKLIDKDLYKDALINLNNKYLTNEQKIILFCIKHKLIVLLKLITEVRKIRDKTIKRKYD